MAPAYGGHVTVVCLRPRSESVAVAVQLEIVQTRRRRTVTVHCRWHFGSESAGGFTGPRPGPARGSSGRGHSA
eukprot:2082765-Rhodomonas_salina.2